MFRRSAAVSRPPVQRSVRSLALVPLLILIGALTQSAAAAAPAQTRVGEILAAVREHGDKVAPAAYEELGLMKSAPALDALEKCVAEVKRPRSFLAIFSAMRHFMETDDLANKALVTVERYARGKRETEARAAANALAGFGPKGYDAMFDVARQAEHPIARAYAVRGLRPALAERADTVSLEVVLDAWVTRVSGSEQQGEALLRVFKDAGEFDRMARFVSARKTPFQMRKLVITAMGGHRRGVDAVIDEGADEVLERGAQSKDAVLRYYAMRTMTRRGGTSRTSVVERLVKDRDPTVRRAAMLVLLRDQSRTMDPFELARDSDEIARQAAAIALAEDGRPEATGALHELLEDEDPTVRGEAIRQAGRRRDKASIPALIDRLDDESGRLRGDAQYVLTMLTGKDLGYRVGAWRTFWRTEGETFQMPTLEEARKLASEREDRKAGGETRVAFYGLDVVSNRFALVVDTSGSMQQVAYAGKTRLEIAQEQLTQTLTRIRDGVLFNVIPFANGARPMEDGLIEMDEEERENAMLFVGRLKPAGGTNVHDALAAAFDDDRIDTIYLLTDGDPSVGEIVDITALREEVARWNSIRGIRIHCIAVGKASRLLEGLAADSGGVYVQVN